MSIIHEALKKAGDDKLSPAAGIQNPKIEIQRTKPRTVSGGLAFVVTLLVASGALMLAPVWKSQRFDRQPAARNLTPFAPETPSVTASGINAQFGIEEMASPAAFILSGVVVGPDKSYGIINNQIIEPGQQVSGATVRAISSDQVTLEYNGQNLILPVSDSK